jgi:hemoglobin
VTEASSRVPDVDLYAAIGGMDACRRLSTAFYARVEHDPLLRPLFPSIHCAIDAFALFLAQFLGGPCEYSERRWWLSLREAHLRFRIGQGERDAWLSDMRGAFEEVSIEEPLRGALLAFFEQSSLHLVNRVDGSPITRDGSGPPADPVHREVARRWNDLRAVEEAVAAVRAGDTDRAVALAESPTLQACFARDRAGLPSLLQLMIGSGRGALIDYAHRRLVGDPGLGKEAYLGDRTLLHAASAAGRLATVELLLRLGADPNSGGHPPLYCVGNECAADSGADVVRTLVRAGADVKGEGGVKRCTALHMAARRGNVRVAAALLDFGADIEARDSLGDTPLRRSVNCGKVELTALLLSRGADAHSVGSRGLTPARSARTAAMKQLLLAPSRSRTNSGAVSRTMRSSSR